MEIRPLVIGTAGHIDHGKSSLVRALTGIDPDRLKEERERGLTIDLGFAPLHLPDGRVVGMVDVPGHERFIKNMVAGATGIDLVLFVVAADDGVMPQTREHLAILEILGLDRGLVALTKIDAVEPELADLAEEDVRLALRGSFLEGAPLVRVSSVTGEGLEELRAALHALLLAIEPRSAEGLFRMPVQRVFSAPGFGTIVTGIPLAGTVRPGDALEVLPGGLRAKVRGIQAYGQPAERARAGHSTALNLADLARADVRRGSQVAAPGFFRAPTMLGARLALLPDLDRPLADRSAVRVHTGTAEVLGEVVLLDARELEPGSSGLVQLRLCEPCACAPGDRYVLRLASPLITLGGGVVLEESRHRLKRFKPFVVEELGRIERGLDAADELVDASLRRAGERLSTLDELAVAVKRPREELAPILAGLAERGLALAREGGTRWIHRDALEQGLGRLRAALERWFEENPLRSLIELRDLRALVRAGAGVLELLLEEEARRGELVLEPGGRVRPAGRRAPADPAREVQRERIAERMRSSALSPPSPQELAEELGLREPEVAQLLRSLADEGRVAHLGKGLYLSSGALDRARAAVVANCERHGELQIPELRDELGTTRKFLIPLLEHFDAIGLTLRHGARRVLRTR